MHWLPLTSIAYALDDAFLHDSQGSQDEQSNVSQEEQLAKLADRVEMLEGQMPNGNALDAYLDGEATSSLNPTKERLYPVCSFEIE
jgi:hypothetical protein